MRTSAFFCFLFFGFSTLATGSVTIREFSTNEFNPSANQEFKIPVEISKAGEIIVEIYTSDSDLVRTIAVGKKDKAGLYEILWDGRDDEKIIVPDEAYIPVVKLLHEENNDENYEYDPRKISGGEEINIYPQASAKGQISFQLDQPSRVLARAGVKSGPMMNSILNWEVRGKGRNVVLWNGYDQDGLVNLFQKDNLALLLTGFELPKHAILTHGNQSQSYSEWRQSKAWSSELPDLSEAIFERQSRRLSRHYYLPRSVDIDPRVSLTIVDDLPQNKQGVPIVTGPILLKVGMHDEDRWAMQQSLFEVSFFVDYEFLSEEEQGYVPLTWRWNPGSLAPGIHIVTVNVSGFNGQVGVKSLQIEIQK